MKTPESVPEPKMWLANWFSRHAEKRLRKEFHRVRLLGPEPPAFEGPLVAYANHSSWWDPLVALAIRPLFFPERQAYAPIAAEMLERYGIFKHLGFFGVDSSSLRGVVEFLQQAEAVLGRPSAMLYLTPQGRFADVRDRPARFQGGIGSLAARVEGAGFLPLAVEYVFWEESKPEILLRFGEIRRFPAGVDRTGAARVLESALEAEQDRLAKASMERSAEPFRTVLRGRSGVGGVYDLWRSLRARMSGRTPELGHGKL